MAKIPSSISAMPSFTWPNTLLKGSQALSREAFLAMLEALSLQSGDAWMELVNCKPTKSVFG